MRRVIRFFSFSFLWPDTVASFLLIIMSPFCTVLLMLCAIVPRRLLFGASHSSRFSLPLYPRTLRPLPRSLPLPLPLPHPMMLSPSLPVSSIEAAAASAAVEDQKRRRKKTKMKRKQVTSPWWLMAPIFPSRRTLNSRRRWWNMHMLVHGGRGAGSACWHWRWSQSWKISL